MIEAEAGLHTRPGLLKTRRRGRGGASVALREATVADYPAIRELLHDSDSEHARQAPELARVPETPRFTAGELAELLTHDSCLVLVAEEGGAVVGFVETTIRSPERPDEAACAWCSVNNLAVAQPWRGRGIGTSLVAATEGWARRKGLAQLRLDVFGFNRAARGLYDRLGYRTAVRQLVKAL